MKTEDVGLDYTPMNLGIFRVMVLSSLHNRGHDHFSYL